MNPAVLIVDDEQSICTALQRTFRKEQFDVFSANSGKEALELLDNNSIDVIVSDQRMPGMTGTELLSIVKDSHPDIGRIILSGHSDVHDLTDAINEACINQFLPKPWQDDHLISTVNRAIRKSNLDIPASSHLRLNSAVEPIHFCPSHAISALNKTYQINLEKDIKNDQLSLNQSHHQVHTKGAFALNTYQIQWPTFSNFGHDGIVNMASQSGYLNELFSWYLIKINESLNEDNNNMEYKIVDLFFDQFIHNALTKQLLTKIISSDSKLIFKIPFELLQKEELNDFLKDIYHSNHSLLLNIGKRVIDISGLESTPVNYVEMDSKASSLDNHLLTEKRLHMLNDAQNMGIKTILSKSHSKIQRNYANSMGFDYS